MTAVHRLLGRNHRGHEAVVFGHHQRYARVGGHGYYGPRFPGGAGQRLLHQDALACAGGQAGVLQVQVMGRADVYGVHPVVGHGAFVGAEAARALELGGEGGGPRRVAAGKVQVNIIQFALNRGGESSSEGAAADDAQAEFHACFHVFLHPYWNWNGYRAGSSVIV